MQSDYITIRRYLADPSLADSVIGDHADFDQPVSLDDGRDIVGTAAVFFDGSRKTEFRIGNNKFERIESTAFDRAIIQRDDVIACLDHNPNKLLGRTSSHTLQLDIDRKGLHYRVAAGDTSAYHTTYGMIRRGEIRGSSFLAYLAPTDFNEFRENGRLIRSIHNVSLLKDVSPCTRPCYKATTASVRSIDRDIREREDYLAELNRQLAIDREHYIRGIQLDAILPR